MNYAKRLREIEEEIKKLKDIKEGLEKAKENAENSGAMDSVLRNFGFMYKLTNDLAMGYLIEQMGQRGINENDITIEGIEKSIYNVSKQIKQYQDEYKEVQKQQQETRQNAELVVEDDKIYIKGDAEKNDILELVKIERQRVVSKIEELKQDKVFNSLIKTKNDLVELLKKHNYPNSEEMRKVLTNIKERTSYNTIKKPYYYYAGGFVFPTYDFRAEAGEDLQSQISSLNEKLALMDEEHKNFKPNLIGRIIPSVGRKQKEEKDFDYNWDRNKLQNQIYRTKQALESLENLSKNVFEPYFKDIQSKALSFKDMLDNKDAYEYYITEYETLVNKLNSNKCFESSVFGIKGILSKDVIDYVEENNLHITDKELYKALNKLNKKYGYLKEEVKPRCKISNETSYDM